MSVQKSIGRTPFLYHAQGIIIADRASFKQAFPDKKIIEDDADQQAYEIIVQVDAGTVCTQPIHLTDLLPALMHYSALSIFIDVGPGAQITIVHKNMNDAYTIAHELITAHVAQGAHLTFVTQCAATQLGMKAQHSFWLKRDGVLAYRTILKGTGVRDYAVDLFLEGEGAHADIKGAYLLNGAGALSLTTTQHHRAAQSTSELIFKGVLTGQASASYHGMIRIDEGAQHTHASQENKNILLSEQARAHSVPSIEVLTNEVSCTHASAIGQCDNELLWYVQSRGLDMHAAQQLMLSAFLSDVIAHEGERESLVREISSYKKSPFC